MPIGKVGGTLIVSSWGYPQGTEDWILTRVTRECFRTRVDEKTQAGWCGNRQFGNLNKSGQESIQ